MYVRYHGIMKNKRGVAAYIAEAGGEKSGR